MLLDFALLKQSQTQPYQGPIPPTPPGVGSPKFFFISDGGGEQNSSQRTTKKFIYTFKMFGHLLKESHKAEILVKAP